nr:MAG TPA: hypothetical protein [Caudoviricetes sp.]
MYGPRTLKVKVVGASFDNDDGSSRQEILRALKGGPFLLPALQRFEYDQAVAKPRLVRKWALIIAGTLITAVFLYDKIIDIIDAII